MSEDFKSAIKSALEPIATKLAIARGLQLLRIEVRGTERQPVIEIILDGDRPILLDDCEQISRLLNDEVAAGGFIRGNFRLDVLSPGVDEPIVEDFQLKRNLGRLVELIHIDGEEHSTIHGLLRDFSESEVILQPTKSKARKAHIQLTENLPQEQSYESGVELVRVERAHIVRLTQEVVFKR